MFAYSGCWKSVQSFDEGTTEKAFLVHYDGVICRVSDVSRAGLGMHIPLPSWRSAAQTTLGVCRVPI